MNTEDFANSEKEYTLTKLSNKVYVQMSELKGMLNQAKEIGERGIAMLIEHRLKEYEDQYDELNARIETEKQKNKLGLSVIQGSKKTIINAMFDKEYDY